MVKSKKLFFFASFILIIAFLLSCGGLLKRGVEKGVQKAIDQAEKEAQKNINNSQPTNTPGKKTDNKTSTTTKVAAPCVMNDDKFVEIQAYYMYLSKQYASSKITGQKLKQLQEAKLKSLGVTQSQFNKYAEGMKKNPIKMAKLSRL